MSAVEIPREIREKKLIALREKHARRRRKNIGLDRERLRADFKAFCKEAWEVCEPGRPLKWNWHLDVICDHLQLCAAGKLRRLIITVPPRSMKSYLVNVFYPVWVWLNEPHHQFNNYSNNAKLAIRDSRRSRILILSQWFQERWGDEITLSRDQAEKANYQNSAGGHRMAFGMLGDITGQGADTQIIDDPHDAKSAQSEAERHSVLAVVDDTLPSRFNDYRTGVMIVIMQRLHEEDVAGHLLTRWGKRATHLCFPMEYDPDHPHCCPQDQRTEPGELLWNDRWDEEDIASLKVDLTPYAFSGQYLQRPSPGEGGILNRTWWQKWPKAKMLPECDFIIQVWDTAYEEREENDYSAMTTWGIFANEERQRDEVILLSRFKDRLGFPALKKKARALYDEYEPDVVLIEPKASGKSLIQELRRGGVPAREWRTERSRATGREVDKTARTHAASIVLYDACVWYVAYNGRGEELQWPLEVIEECAAYPKGAHDDLVDTCTMAWLHLRRGWRLTVDSDPEDEPEDPGKADRRQAAYG